MLSIWWKKDKNDVFKFTWKNYNPPPKTSNYTHMLRFNTSEDMQKIKLVG